MNIFRSAALDADAGVACAWMGKGPAPRPDPAALLPLLRDWPAPPPLATVSQVHSGRWLRVDRLPQGAHRVAGEADALITGSPGIALGIATADCLPIVAVDTQARALGVVHAGWRGSLAGVLRNTLEAMQAGLGARPERMVAAIGPAIGACCYQVGEDVAGAFAAASPRNQVVQRGPGGAPHLDLTEVNRLQALEAGLRDGSIHRLGVCTRCQPETCHSYRRDGPQAGRMWLLAALIR